MINGKKVLAFIPGKTGSVGLPGKMFKEIRNFSLLEWSLLAAANSRYIDAIVTSTRDPLVYEIFNNFASRYINYSYKFNNVCIKSFNTIERPLELCSPTSKTEEAISHLFDSNEIYKYYDYFVMLQATSPIRQINLIDSSLEALDCSGRNSLLTVSSHTPFFFKSGKKTEVLFDAKNRKMRQEITDQEMAYHDDGCLYCFKIPMFLKERCRIDNNPILYPNDKLSSMQIDDEIDFFCIKYIMEEFNTTTEYIHNSSKIFRF